MNLSVKQNFVQIILSVCAVVVLLQLFIRAQPVDPDIHNRVVKDIEDLQKRDTELGEAALQLHYRLSNNYDEAVLLMQRIEELDRALMQHRLSGFLPDTPESVRELQHLHTQIQKKAEQLDEFKSSNAVMKNSLIYLPSTVNGMLAQLPKSDVKTIERFQSLLRDALLVSLTGDEATMDLFEADIVNVQAVISRLPKDTRERADRVIMHARTLLESQRRMPALLSALSAYQSQHLGSEVGALYQNYYQHQQHIASIYRLFLLIAAMLALGYSIYVYFRLKEQRQQLEHALAQVGNQQQALNEHAIVSITNVEGLITYVNEKFIEISGYSSSELLGQDHRMINSGVHSKEYFKDLWDTVISGRVWRGQVKNRSKNGECYWVEATIVPFMDKNGKPYQYVAMRTDITEHKEMELQLQAERRLLQNVMDTLGEGVYMLDVEGNCTYLNREAEDIIGWSSEELLGKNLHLIIQSQSPDGSEQESTRLRQAILQNKLYRSESEYFQHKNGTLFPVAIVAQPMLEGDRVVGTVVAFQDISERKFIERELLRAKDAAEAASFAKGSFLATMSHEIRTPMNGILGMTELALDTDLTSEQREYLTMVKSSADSLLTIINDILDFSKIESGKMALELVEFNVRSLFSSTEKALMLRAAQKGVELVYGVDGEIPDNLVGDPGRLRQVVTNLVGNAIKFSDHGAISLQMRLINASAHSVLVRIEVADQGIGISPEQQVHIFEAFTQADASTTRKYGGTGLGLAISSQLVEAMGGQLSVESELGSGSVFSFVITLPKGADVAGVSLPAALSGISALVVDDNEVNRQLLLQIFKKWGVKAIAASNGYEARGAMLEAENEGMPFDLLLFDAMMKSENGFDLAGELRPESLQKVVMMLSSGDLRTDAALCRKIGVGAYISKPIEEGELLGAVKKAVGVQADTATERADAEESVARRLNILLAEDNRVNQKLAVTLLEKWGHRVVIANNGLEAVEKYAEQSYDVILMDLQMPEMGGLEATELIRDAERVSGRHTPIVAMTANAMSEDRQRCLDAGMDDYLSKPLNTEKMRIVLSGLSASVLDEPAPSIRVPDAYDYTQGLLDTDGWVIETIGQAFLDECDSHMTGIVAAIHSGNNVLLVRIAHTLRGLVANFNAKKLEDIARKIESQAQQGELGGIPDLYGELASEMELFKAALVAYLANR